MTAVVIAHRKANGALCPCGAAVLAGIDADRCGLQAVVDPRPLSRTGELLAVLDGRRVYALAAGRHLHRRDAWSIRRPAAEPVLAAHRCGHPPPGHWLAPAPPARRPAPASTEEPTW